MANLLDKLRNWIDSDEFIETDKILIQKSVSYESENFLRQLLQKVDELLLKEIVRLPNGKVYVPARFIIYLSKEENDKLRKDKRKFIEETLSDLILEKAQERAGDAKLNTKIIKCTLDVNSSDEVQVVAVSDESIDLSNSQPLESNVVPERQAKDDFHQARTLRNSQRDIRKSTVDQTWPL